MSLHDIQSLDAFASNTVLKSTNTAYVNCSMPLGLRTDLILASSHCRVSCTEAMLIIRDHASRETERHVKSVSEGSG